MTARGLLLGSLLLLFVAGCSPFYVIRAGYEEARILARRQPIAALVADPETPPDVRGKLGLVLEARTYAEQVLELDAGDSYTTFSQLDSDTLALVLSAAYPDRFEPYTWWFPIVGRVPYKGYFDEDDAFAAARSLEARGFDTFVRPTSAFSTLGWFNDPLVSPLLRYDSISLGGTVIHELVHNTVYIPGQATFNESFAEFVGGRGAIDFFCQRYGELSRKCRVAIAVWEDQLVFGAFLDELVGDLETIYGDSALTRDEKLVRREAVFASARRDFREQVQPRLQALSFSSFIDQPLNNATLLSRRIYYHRLDLFDRVYQAMGADLPRTIATIIEAAEEGRADPYAAVAGLLREGVTGASTHPPIL